MQANRLREIRETHDLKRQDVAVALDVDPTTVYRWETGRSPISDDQKRRLAQLLEVSIVGLMGWDTEVAPIERGRHRRAGDQPAESEQAA